MRYKNNICHLYDGMDIIILVSYYSHFDIKIEENKTYSWDLKRQTIDTSKFIIEDAQNKEIGRVPGDINGKRAFLTFLT